MNESTDRGGSDAPREIDTRVVDNALRLVVIGLIAYGAFTLVAPFIVVIVWAAILATALFPVHAWLKARFGGRSKPASLLITLTALVLVLGPSAALTASLAGSIQDFATDLSAGTLDIPAPDPSVQGWPLIGGKLFDAWNAAYTDLPTMVADNKELFVSAGRNLLGLATGLGGDVLIFAVAIVIAGFLYSRGEPIADRMRRLAGRIGGTRGASFVGMAGATIRNVSRGVIGVSMLQALLAGIGLMAAGVPGAGVLTLAILILAIVQIGPTVVIVPVIIWVWSDMDTLTAILFTAWMLPVNFSDNVLKPIVMARGLTTPMLVIFIGVIGGTLTHGLIGLFLGPVVLAVFYDMVVNWVGDEPAVADGGKAESETPTKPPA